MEYNLNKDIFSLVLSGGGALGIAHLGVLADLEKKLLKPKEIVGTSMGGIIGASFAIGMSENDIYKQIKLLSSVSKWISFSFSGNSIVKNDKIKTIFEDIFEDRKMKDTKIPLKLIATNLKNGDKKVFDCKDDIYIKDAVLATMAIPGIFEEHVVKNEVYVDGFLCENLGLNEASYEQVLAVDVLGKNSFDKDLPENFFKTNNVLDMLEKAMRLIIYNQSKTQIKNSKKKIILIEPKTKKYKTFHFHKVDEIRSLGLGLLP